MLFLGFPTSPPQYDFDFTAHQTGGLHLSCKVNTNKLIVSRTAYGMQIYVELHIYKCPHRRQKLTLLFLFTDLFHKEIFLTLSNNRKVNTLHLL